MKNNFFYFLLALILTGCGQKYSGVITDKEGKPLEGVTISVIDTDSILETDVDGKWSYELSEDGKESFLFYKEGYMYEQIVDVKPASKINVTMRLKVNSLATEREAKYIQNGCSSVSVPDNADWNTSFLQSALKGDLAPDPKYTRRDPSAVIKVDSLYYMWYSFSMTDDTLKRAPWDLNDLYYATSADGIIWDEKGAAVLRGAEGEFDHRSVFTTEIFEHEGKFYLVYQAAKDLEGIYDRNTVGMAQADSPDGPWAKLEKPVLRPTYTSDIQFDNNAVHDPCVVKYNDKFYLYYKGECNCFGADNCKDWCNPICGFSKQVRWGVAISDNPTGPYVKSDHNPVTNTGHEVMVWPYKDGIAILQHQDGPEARTIQFAADGLNFEIMGMVSNIPEAAGLYRAPVSEEDPRAGIAWGVGHVLRWNAGVNENGWMYINRFDIVEASTKIIDGGAFDKTGGTFNDGVVPFGFNTTGAGASHVNVNDWAEYIVDFDEAGDYVIEYYISTPLDNARVSLYVNNKLVDENDVRNSGDWGDFSEPILSEKPISFEQGKQTLKIVASGTSEWQWNFKGLIIKKAE